MLRRTPHSRLALPFRVHYGSVRFVIVAPKGVRVDSVFVGGANGPAEVPSGEQLDPVTQNFPFDVKHGSVSTTVQCPMITHYGCLLVPKESKDMATSSKALIHNGGYLSVLISNPELVKGRVTVYVAFCDSFRLAVPWTIPRFVIGPRLVKPDTYTDQGGVITLPSVVTINHDASAPMFNPTRVGAAAVISATPIPGSGPIVDISKVDLDGALLDIDDWFELGFIVTPGATRNFVGFATFSRGLRSFAGVPSLTQLEVVASVGPVETPIQISADLLTPVLVDGFQTASALVIKQSAWSSPGVMDLLYPDVSGRFPVPIPGPTQVVSRNYTVTRFPSSPTVFAQVTVNPDVYLIAG